MVGITSLIKFNSRHYEVVINWGGGEYEVHKFDSLKRATDFIHRNNLKVSFTEGI